MAEFKMTLSDGSEAYLSHHGVKGMHWGVRNEETLARYDREGSALAKKDGYITTEKHQGRKYLEYKKKNEKASNKSMRFLKKHSQSEIEENKKLKEKEDRLYGEWEKSEGNLRDFQSIHLQRVKPYAEIGKKEADKLLEKSK